MKKHAFLIGAYKNPDYLLELIDSLDGPRSNFYIHINKKNTDDFKDLRLIIDKRENVSFVPSIKVIWGGMTLLKSLNIMMNEALKNEENEYFHFLTGQDALVRPLEQLYAFFDKNKDNNYISTKIDKNPIRNSDAEELDWIQYHHTYDWFDNRGNLFSRIFEKLFVGVQKMLGFKRCLPHEKIYKGTGWFSLNRKGALILYEAMNDKKELKKWHNCFATEEFFIPTILNNNPYDLNIINDSLRYIDWSKGPGPYPSTLDETFYEDIVKSGKFFCRKIDPKKSRLLLNSLPINK
jgi:hypothetical protein